MKSIVVKICVAVLISFIVSSCGAKDKSHLPTADNSKEALSDGMWIHSDFEDILNKYVKDGQVDYASLVNLQEQPTPS